MAASFEKYQKRRLRSSYFSVTVSIALVLFLLGILGLLVVNAQSIAREVRENFTITVILHADTPEPEARQFQKTLELRDEIKSTEFIPRDEAARELKEDLGEDFVGFLGVNPLQDAININLTSEFVESGNIAEFSDEILSNAFVNEVQYDPDLLHLINENIQRIGIFLIGGAVLLLLVSITLINSSIRLSIYSRRFLIKTMQLVGATRLFIQKPFMRKGIRLGLMGGIVANLLLAGMFAYLYYYVPQLDFMTDPIYMASISVGLILLGVLISWLCTIFAVNKYLKLKTDQLYF